MLSILPCSRLDIAFEPKQYLDIAWEGGFWPAFDYSFDLPFNLQGTKGTAMKNFILYIVDFVMFTCGIEYFYF